MCIQCPSKYTRKVLGLLNELSLGKDLKDKSYSYRDKIKVFPNLLISPIAVGNKCHANNK
jgi:hypothetical protein